MATVLHVFTRRGEQKILWELLLAIRNHGQTVSEMTFLTQCGALVEHACDTKMTAKIRCDLLAYGPSAVCPLLSKRIPVTEIASEPMQVEGVNGVWRNFARHALVIRRNFDLSAIVTTGQVISRLASFVEALFLIGGTVPRMIRVAVRNPIAIDGKRNEVVSQHRIIKSSLKLGHSLLGIGGGESLKQWGEWNSSVPFGKR